MRSFTAFVIVVAFALSLTSCNLLGGSDRIEGLYTMNNADLMLFDNGRYVKFYMATPLEYGVWRFEGRDIILTTKLVTALEAQWNFGTRVGNVAQLLADKQNGEIEGWIRVELNPRIPLNEQGDYEDSSETVTASKEHFLKMKEETRKLVVEEQ